MGLQVSPSGAASDTASRVYYCWAVLPEMGQELLGRSYCVKCICGCCDVFLRSRTRVGKRTGNSMIIDQHIVSVYVGLSHVNPEYGKRCVYSITTRVLALYGHFPTNSVWLFPI